MMFIKANKKYFIEFEETAASDGSQVVLASVVEFIISSTLKGFNRQRKQTVQE